MNIFIGADHRGFRLKEELRIWLIQSGYEVTDLGAADLLPTDDYPDYAVAVAQKVITTEDSKGIVICGSGVGVDIVANKVKGIRSALGSSVEEIKSGREDDDINVLALGADYTDFEKAKLLIKTFLETPFKNEERYLRRIEKIENTL